MCYSIGWPMPEIAPSRRYVAAYGVLALPLAFGGLPLYIQAPDFFATERGVPLAALGLALFWLRLFDAMVDPVAGWAGDRWHSLILVNLMTLGGLWRREPDQKSRISAAREGFGLVGLILAVVLPSALQQLIGRQAALLALAAVLAVALLIALPIFRGWLASVRLQIAVPPDARPDWHALMPFYAVAALVLLSAAFPAALILMLVRDLLGVEALAGVFLLTYFAAALPGAAVAGWLAGCIGGVPVWTAALILSMAGFAFAMMLGPGDVAAFFVICLATGFCFGADLVLPPAILSDRIEATSTQAAATRAYAALGFLTKLALALAGAVALPLLQLAGFRPALVNDTHALQALLLLYAALPLVLRGVAVTALIFLHRKGEI